MTRNNHSRRKDVRAYMARHGDLSYTQALRALDDQTTPSPVSDPFEEVDPTYAHDVNPLCGHWIGRRCGGCGVCQVCDGCYCAEIRQEAEEYAYNRQVERAHAEHIDEPGKNCPTCEYDRQRSKGFTECPKCAKALHGFWHFREHIPPYCFKDLPHPPGLDWSHLVGKRIALDTYATDQGKMGDYAPAWTGTVTGRWRNPAGHLTHLYELRLDPTVPQPNDATGTIEFNPREFTITEH